MDWMGFLGDNWFALAQSLGIIGGLAYNAVALRKDVQARRTADQILLTEQHRELWSEVHRRPELMRLLDPDADPDFQPLTPVEEHYLRLVFVHFHTGWLIAQSGQSLIPVGVLATDAGHFFKLPAPAALWAEVRKMHQPEFVTFVDRAVAAATWVTPRPTVPAATTESAATPQTSPHR